MRQEVCQEKGGATKRILVFSTQGESILIGPNEISKNFLLLAVVFEALRYRRHHGPLTRSEFLLEIKQILEKEAEKTRGNPQLKLPQLTKLRLLMDSFGIAISTVPRTDNYLLSISKGPYTKNPRGLVNEINQSLNNDGFQKFVQDASQSLRAEVEQKVAKALAAKLTLAHGNPAWIETLRIDPKDKRHQKAMDCFERISGKFIDEKIERALTGPKIMKD